MYIWRPGQLPIGQTAKARSDTVCSHSVRDATANVEPILYTPRPLSWSKIALPFYTAGGFDEKRAMSRAE